MLSLSIADHPRNSVFVKRGKLVRFADLPVTAQDALIHYMSVDGAAWAVEEDWEDWQWGEGKPDDLATRALVLADIAKFRDRFVATWGDELFGYVEIPYGELLEAINGDDDFVDTGDKFGIPSLNDPWRPEYDIPTWPVILSSFSNETLTDGWSRFTRYCQLGLPVPALWYPNF